MRKKVVLSTKVALRSAFSALPFRLAVRLARGRPNWAFYIGDRDRSLVIDDYLKKFRVSIDTRSDTQRRMLSRIYEKDVLEIIERFVPDGGICIDVGANVGAHTLAMAECAGAGGIVHAVEPGPQFVARLRENVALNPRVASRIAVYELGLSDHEGTARWQEAARDPGTASMHWIDTARPFNEVPVITLDRLSDEQKLTRLDLIKIDVDGMDHLVIRGAARTIARFRPVVVLETMLCDAEQIAAAQEATTTLKNLGYRLYRLDRGKFKQTDFPRLSMETLALPDSASWTSLERAPQRTIA